MFAITDPKTTIAQIVTDHPAAARVFQKHRLDFCCHGDVPLAEACARKGLDARAIAAELSEAVASPSAEPAEALSKLSTPELIATIVRRHHGYLREALPYILPVAAKVAMRHGERNAALESLLDAVQALASALIPHLDQEESVLFPGLTAAAPDRAWAARELAAMREEHLAVGKLLDTIRERSDGFSTPEWGCKTYRVLMHELEALETDVLRHVHLENHVLAPRFAA